MSASLSPARSFQLPGQVLLACTVLLGLTLTGLAVQHTQTRNQARQEQLANAAFLTLEAAERQGRPLAERLEGIQQYLVRFPGSSAEPEVRRLREQCQLRLEERVLEAVRLLAREAPLDFRKRHAALHDFLDRYPRSALAADARVDLQRIEEEWDRYDFRTVRDRFFKNPNDLAAVVELSRAYVSAHPQGKFVTAARELLRWTERVMTPEEYRVTLQSGQIDRGLARFFSRGPDLSVEIEVAGVRYGPSTITVNTYQPHWSYDFPRPIRWKAGDPVTIRVRDHDYGQRTILEITSETSDNLAMRWLSGEVWSGANMLSFRSDFHQPELPPVD